MFFSFLLCFLTIIFSIYCIGVQQVNATSKADSSSCNPWLEEECPFSKEYLNELVKYYENDQKYESGKNLPNPDPKPPSIVDDIIKFAKDVGPDVASEALDNIEIIIQNKLAKQLAKNIVPVIGVIIDYLTIEQIYRDEILQNKLKQKFCNNNPDNNFCKAMNKSKPEKGKYLCEFNTNKCSFTPYDIDCGVNPTTGQNECVHSYQNPNPIEPNFRDCRGLYLYDGSLVDCIFDNAEEASKAANPKINEGLRIIEQLK